MTKKRRRFDKEFKLEAIKMVLDQGLTRAEVGRSLGVDHTTAGNWVKYDQRNMDLNTDDSILLSGERKKIKELEKKLRLQEMEIEFLKKTAHYFAKEQK